MEPTPKKSAEYIERCWRANQVDGIISGSHNLGIEDYNRVTAPIIAFDRNLPPRNSVVSSSTTTVGILVAETLVKTGAQNIIMYHRKYNYPTPNGNSPLRVLVLSCQTLLSLECPKVIFQPFCKEMEIKQILKSTKNQMPFCFRMIWQLS